MTGPIRFDPDGYLIHDFHGQMRSLVMSRAMQLQADNDRYEWFLQQVRIAMEVENQDLREAIIERALTRMDRTEPVQR